MSDTETSFEALVEAPGRPRGRRPSRSVTVLGVVIATVAVLAGLLHVARPALREALFRTGEFTHQGVSTVVAGRSDDANSVWGSNVKGGHVVLSADGCLVLEDVSGTGLDGPRLISWPRGSRLAGDEGDVHVRLASGERIQPGDVITFGAYAAFAPEHHVHLPQACRALAGIHLQTTLGPVEVREEA